MSAQNNYLFVDASYYIFFRYHALRNWWKLAKKDEPQDCSASNAAFVTKFKQLFISKFKEIFKKLKLDPKTTKVFVGKDCFQHEIWRNQHTTGYKDGRAENNDIGAFFKMIYAENLFTTIPGVNVTLLEYPSLEADDCIALAVKTHNDDIVDNVVSHKYFIITSDHDTVSSCHRMPALSSTTSNTRIYAMAKRSSITAPKLFVKVCSGTSRTIFHRSTPNVVL